MDLQNLRLFFNRMTMLFMNLNYLFFCTYVALLILGIALVYKYIVGCTREFNTFSKRNLPSNVSNSLTTKTKMNFLRNIDDIFELTGITRLEIIRELFAKSTLIALLPLFISQVIGLSQFQTLVLILVLSISFSYWLIGYRKRVVRQYRDDFDLEFPDFVESLSLALNSGLPFLGAVSRVIREFEGLESSDGQTSIPTARSRKWILAGALSNNQQRSRSSPLMRELAILQSQISSGESTQYAFDGVSRRIRSSSVANFVDVITISLARGTPLSSQLNEYSLSIRESQRRSLMERAGRAEVKMMVPVVFLLLPISVLFALWPSFQQLQQLVISP